MPRTVLTSRRLATRRPRNGLTRAMAISRASGMDSSRPSSASIRVSARPPSGPLGYWPTSSMGQ
ncbi:Uncharacterised protein [Bordetella pertussis]|nr:Uncharacterised protein [Bordetella pertussis]